MRRRRPGFGCALVGLVACAIAAAVVLGLMQKAHSATLCTPSQWPPVARAPVKIESGAIRWLALTAWAEARGEARPYCAMTAVAFVILNRLRTNPDAFGRTVRAVVHQRYQFSVWNDGADRDRLNAVGEHDPSYLLAHLAATSAALGLVSDPTNGALYFISAAMTSRPDWVRSMELTARIGGHLFYKPKRG